jgi:peptidoglycan/LPS O-acetylase OafA/YrhL
LNLRKSPRFDLLDGLRGIAAVAVMIYHYTEIAGLRWLTGAWVAVDLFFVLSGFVIAYSYGKKILDGMSFQQFIAVRLIRLGPLYVLGLIIGLIGAGLMSPAHQAAQLTETEIAKAAILGLLWLPNYNIASWPFGVGTPWAFVFPLNGPAWSLFFELFVNILFFSYVYRYRNFSSIKLVFFASLVFITCTISFGIFNPGWSSRDFPFGFPRVIAEFFLGALIFALGIHQKRISIDFSAFCALLTLILFFSGNKNIAFVSSITLVPLTIASISTVAIHGAQKSICKVLGEISYPLYIIHVPLFRLIYELFNITSLNPIVQVSLMACIAVGLSFWLARADTSLRKFILKNFSNRIFLAR